MTSQSESHYQIPYKGEDPKKGWVQEFVSSNPIIIPEGTVLTAGRIGRVDGLYYDLVYLGPNDQLNPMSYGAGAVIEKSNGQETVGSAITVLTHDEKGTILISTIEQPGTKRLGRGMDIYLEIPRASNDNLEGIIKQYKLQEKDAKPGKPAYANNARITGDAPKGAPINTGVAILEKPIEELKWKTLEEFALDGDDFISLGSVLRALGLLGMLGDLHLPEEAVE